MSYNKYLGCSCTSMYPTSMHPTYPENRGLGFAFVPFLIAMAVSGAQSGTMAWLARKNPKQKSATSSYANEIEQKMIENLRAWESVPVEQRNAATKATAISTFDMLWSELVNYCGDPGMGEPGQRCIDERDNIPGSRSGKDYNWFRAYRDPILNYQVVDPQNDNPILMAAGQTTSSNSITGVLSSYGLSTNIVGAIAVGLLVGFFVKKAL